MKRSLVQFIRGIVAFVIVSAGLVAFTAGGATDAIAKRTTEVERCDKEAKQPPIVSMKYRRDAQGRRTRDLELYVLDSVPWQATDQSCAPHGHRVLRINARRKSTPGEFRRGKWRRTSKVVKIVPGDEANGGGAFSQELTLPTFVRFQPKKFHHEVLVRKTWHWSADGTSVTRSFRFDRQGLIDDLRRTDNRLAKGGKPVE